ncbi:molybdopterin-dependent oxidoreductase [Iamia sp.]|uniref:molybdopterin-dependent oxidoreductase n=1 Tax=Iamia sp. TaxID=2722710 RepID=UPI002D13D3B9|nr:molybdopterin-dependent oxidoreductase [Iamia sp.]HXH57838.1 molybdopterin-dependent oxidoreductase [Iamia sp.]
MAGALAAAAALAAAELVNLAAPTRPSLLIAVETWFVDTFAGALKDIAVALFGTADKIALAVGAVLLLLVFGVLAGKLEAKDRWRGVALIVGFGLAGVAATARHPQGSVPVASAAALVGVAVGTVVLLTLLDRFDVRVAPGAARAFADRRAPDPGAASGGGDGPPVGALAEVAGTRRDVMVWGLGAGALIVTGGVLAKGVGDRLRRARSIIPDSLPAAAPPASVPTSQPFEATGLSPYITPTRDFYRIDTAIQTPFVVTDEWTLKVTGMVDNELELTYAELVARDLVEEVVTLSCVSNEVGGDLVGNARWTGIGLRDVLAEAGVAPGATQIVGESVDGFTAGFPTSILDDPDRPALVAVGMNGQPLPRAHGFPARLVIAGIYGYVSATKWLSEIRLTTLEGEDGYWIDRGWAKEAPIKTSSRIDVPRRGDRLVAGTVPVAGVAWAPNRGIQAVEVRVDGGSWQQAELGRVASDDTWVQWHLAWEAPGGDHVIEVRATDGDGRTQSRQEVAPIPDGAEGWHRQEVSVAER